MRGKTENMDESKPEADWVHMKGYSRKIGRDWKAWEDKNNR